MSSYPKTGVPPRAENPQTRGGGGGAAIQIQTRGRGGGGSYTWGEGEADRHVGGGGGGGGERGNRPGGGGGAFGDRGRGWRAAAVSGEHLASPKLEEAGRTLHPFFLWRNQAF